MTTYVSAGEPPSELRRFPAIARPLVGEQPDGFEHVEFYEGSLTEWEAQDRPLATGGPGE